MKAVDQWLPRTADVGMVTAVRPVLARTIASRSHLPDLLTASLVDTSQVAGELQLDRSLRARCCSWSPGATSGQVLNSTSAARRSSCMLPSSSDRRSWCPRGSWPSRVARQVALIECEVEACQSKHVVHRVCTSCGLGGLWGAYGGPGAAREVINMLF